MNIAGDIARIKSSLEKEMDQKITIALFGQPGAGKSSIINKLVGYSAAETGVKTDATMKEQLIHYSGDDGCAEAMVLQNLCFVDLPGYGTTKFPAAFFMREFAPERFDLFICVFAGKFHEADTDFFRMLKAKGKVCLFVRNKHDDIWEEGKAQKDLENTIVEDAQRQIGAPVKVYFTSCKTGHGLGELQEGIINALEPAKREKYARLSKAYTRRHLADKKKACESLVVRYAGLAAANAINIIPGLDIGVDLGVLLKLFNYIRDAYGLTGEKVKSIAPALTPIAINVFKYGTREGIPLLLKQFTKNMAGKELSKYFPIVGQAIAAGLGFAITYRAGHSYLDDCHKVAAGILENELKLGRN